MKRPGPQLRLISLTVVGATTGPKQSEGLKWDTRLLTDGTMNVKDLFESGRSIEEVAADLNISVEEARKNVEEYAEKDSE